MQQDEVIWQVINQGFCSYRVPTESETFCKSEYNVTNLCRRGHCPLANSNYATVREIDGVLYLYVKVIERAHMPKHLWEKIRLSRNYTRALAQIDEHLEYWSKFLRHKCKQRMTKLVQVLHRMRKIRMKTRPQLVRIHKKTERREAVREEKAERAAKVEKNIQRELLARLNKGVYGGLYQFDEEAEAEMEEEMEEEMDDDVEYVEDIPDDMYDIDSDDDEEDLEDIIPETRKRRKSQAGPRRKRKGVEWEMEEEGAEKEKLIRTSH